MPCHQQHSDVTMLQTLRGKGSICGQYSGSTSSHAFAKLLPKAKESDNYDDTPCITKNFLAVRKYHMLQLLLPNSMRASRQMQIYICRTIVTGTTHTN